VRSHQSRVEGQNPLSRPAGHASPDAAQDTVGPLGCQRTLPAPLSVYLNNKLLFTLSTMISNANPQLLLPLVLPPLNDKIHLLVQYALVNDFTPLIR